MNITLKNFHHMPSTLTALSEKFFSGPIQKAIALLTVAIFGCLALYSFFSFRNYKGKTLKQNPQQTNKVNKFSHSKIISTHAPLKRVNQIGKLPLPKNSPNISQKPRLNSNPVDFSKPSKGFNKALETYRNLPNSQKVITRVEEMQISMIFNSIESIEQEGKKFSLVDLMLQVSGLKGIDLNNSECARVVKDTFKYCNKETSEQLSIWLNKQDDFSFSLLRSCLIELIDKYNDGKTVSLVAIRQLMKIYQDKGWNKKTKTSKALTFDSEIISAMKILIQDSPNDNHVVALGEWMMKQPEFNSSIFHDWRKIFLKKQQDNKTAINLYYPLFQTMKTTKYF